MLDLLKRNLKFALVVAILGVANLGVASQRATAQTCPTDRCNCAVGECQECSGCICWSCTKGCCPELD